MELKDLLSAARSHVQRAPWETGWCLPVRVGIQEPLASTSSLETGRGRKAQSTTVHQGRVDPTKCPPERQRTLAHSQGPHTALPRGEGSSDCPDFTFCQGSKVTPWPVFAERWGHLTSAASASHLSSYCQFQRDSASIWLSAGRECPSLGPCNFSLKR